MPKDKTKPSNPLFEDPFAEPDKAQEVRDAEVKTKVDSEKRSAAKTKPTSRKQAPKKAAAEPKNKKKATAKPEAVKKAADPAKSKSASQKQTTKKTTAKPTAGKKSAAKPRAEKKAAAPAKSASQKQTTKKTTAKPTAGKKAAAKPEAVKKAAAPAKSKPASRKQTTKKTTAKLTAGKKSAAKPRAEKKAAAPAKPEATSQKRLPKKKTAKPKVEEKITLESKQDVSPVHVLEESSKTVEIEEQPTMEAESFVESDQGTTLPSDTSSTLLETLIASLDEEDTDYERRALAALPFVRRAVEIEGEQHVVFNLAETEYAVPIESMIEIGEPLTTTPVPNVPEWVLGVANLRGDILSVVDLRVFLGLPPRYQGEESRMLVMQSSDKEISTCLIVDDVRGIRYLQMDRLAKHTVPATDVMAQFIDGVLKQDESEIMVLDIDRLLLSERMKNFS